MNIKLLLLILFTAISASAFQVDTNNYFNSKQLTFELAPTFTSETLHLKKPDSYGYSFQATYWTSENFGSALEIGLWNYNNYQTGLTDHLSALELYRVVPFAGIKYLNRIDFELKTGATTWLSNGAKSIELGGGINYAINKKLDVGLDFTSHYLIVGKQNESTVRFGLIWVF